MMRVCCRIARSVLARIWTRVRVQVDREDVCKRAARTPRRGDVALVERQVLEHERDVVGRRERTEALQVLDRVLVLHGAREPRRDVRWSLLSAQWDRKVRWLHGAVGVV